MQGAAGARGHSPRPSRRRAPINPEELNAPTTRMSSALAARAWCQPRGPSTRPRGAARSGRAPKGARPALSSARCALGGLLTLLVLLVGPVDAGRKKAPAAAAAPAAARSRGPSAETYRRLGKKRCVTTATDDGPTLRGDARLPPGRLAERRAVVHAGGRQVVRGNVRAGDGRAQRQRRRHGARRGARRVAGRTHGHLPRSGAGPAPLPRLTCACTGRERGARRWAPCAAGARGQRALARAQRVRRGTRPTPAPPTPRIGRLGRLGSPGAGSRPLGQGMLLCPEGSMFNFFPAVGPHPVAPRGTPPRRTPPRGTPPRGTPPRAVHVPVHVNVHGHWHGHGHGHDNACACSCAMSTHGHAHSKAPCPMPHAPCPCPCTCTCTCTCHRACAPLRPVGCRGALGATRPSRRHTAQSPRPASLHLWLHVRCKQANARVPPS